MIGTNQLRWASAQLRVAQPIRKRVLLSRCRVRSWATTLRHTIRPETRAGGMRRR
jgi:hypothetical protein